MILSGVGHGVKDVIPSFHAMPHRLTFFVYPGFQLLDLSGPLSAFQMAADSSRKGRYQIEVVSTKGGAVSSAGGLTISTKRLSPGPIDTLIVVGGRGAWAIADFEKTVKAIQRLAGRSTRIASVCTGAFLLACAGLLDGRRATTHWRYARRLQRDYPRVKVDMDKIFIKDGAIWTSAGITAGIDLALAMIEEDMGIDVARGLAQELVVYLRRPGGQSQFSAMLDLEPESDRIKRTLLYIQENLAAPLDLETLAEVARISTRHFGRSFRTETGETPAKAVERLRIEAALPRVEEGAESIELIASSVGFSDPERMRRAFIRHYGHPPQALRRVKKL
jgi:transcriptional regulator GlxA family with amidase domain